MERPPSQVAAQAFTALASSCVRFPAGVFQLGARLEDLPRALRALDVRERLSLGALLGPTPPRWTFLPAFSLAARPVTNGEYLLFVEDPGYEDPARWQRVFEDHPVASTPVASPRGTPRSFLSALVRSLVAELERELSLDGTRSSELAWVTALATRALAPYLPGDHRRELAALERERLAALEAELSPGGPGPSGPAWRLAFEALDATIGRLRARWLEDAGEDAGGQVPPELERALRDRDEAAPDFPVASLKLLDRIRTSLGRAAREGDRTARVPLRAVVAPLAWGSLDPRLLGGERPDRLPWAERPVTGVSLHEALAYADWIARGSGERARVRLPSEAQLERAATWPVAPAVEGPDGRARELVDPRWKMLFPWERRGAEDPGAFEPEEPPRSFAQLAGQGARAPLDLELPALRDLVRRTARVVRDGDRESRLEMLLGFHWEWTRDRVAEEPAVLKHHRGARTAEAGPERDREPAPEAWTPSGEGPLPLAAAADVAPTSPWFAARGGPARVAGSPLATRRFGFDPLRGSLEIGFRLVLEAPAPARSGAEARP